MSTSPTDSTQKVSSNHLHRQLGIYSLAAVAAGVSMLALTAPADGEVVVTRKTIPIPAAPYGTPDTVKISMANNGIDNFYFNLDISSVGSWRTLLAYGANGQDGVIAINTWSAYALPLARGSEIGPTLPKSGTFSYFLAIIEESVTNESGGYCKGYWGGNPNDRSGGCGNPKDKYLGVRFALDGETHYGWIRLTVTTNSTHVPAMTAKITGFAYETEANTPIYAGTAERPTAEVEDPENIRNQSGPALGMLALGADGLPLWRPEESPASN